MSKRKKRQAQLKYYGGDPKILSYLDGDFAGSRFLVYTSSGAVFATGWGASGTWMEDKLQFPSRAKAEEFVAKIGAYLIEDRDE